MDINFQNYNKIACVNQCAVGRNSLNKPRPLLHPLPQPSVVPSDATCSASMEGLFCAGGLCNLVHANNCRYTNYFPLRPAGNDIILSKQRRLLTLGTIVQYRLRSLYIELWSLAILH